MSSSRSGLLLRLLLASSLAGTAGCSGGDSASAGPLDATADDGPETVSDGGLEAADPSVCTVSIADYCAANPGACPAYDELLHPSALMCEASEGIYASAPCGGLVTQGRYGVDTGDDYTYDEATHALVSISGHTNGAFFCVAGKSDPYAGVDLSACTPGDRAPGCSCPPVSDFGGGAPELIVQDTAAVCDDAQIEAFLSCIPQEFVDAGVSCQRFSAQGTPGDRACAACLAPDAGASGGPMRAPGAWAGLDPNVANCLAVETHDAGAQSCAERYAANHSCRMDACYKLCWGSNQGAIDSCVQRAGALPECATTDPTSCLTTDAGPTAAAVACGAFASRPDQFRAVARHFCGAPRDAGGPDSGAPDGGTD